MTPRAVAMRVALVLTAGTTGAFAQSPDTLTLRQAVASALAQSPRLRPSDDARQLAELRAEQTEGRYGLKASPSLSTGSDALGNPQRTFGLGLSKRLPTGADLQLNASSFRYGQDAALTDTGYTMNFVQPLFRGFGVTTVAERALARRSVAGAERNASDARRQLIVMTAEAYFAVLRQRHQVENSARALDRARALRIASAARAKVGMATELDVLRADLLTARAESAQAQAGEQLAGAIDNLKITIGRRLEAPLEIAEEDLSDAALEHGGFGPDAPLLAGDADAIVDRLSQTALLARLDLQEARDRIGDARRSEAIARWNLFPTTAMNVAYTRRGLGASTDLFGPLLNGWRVGFSSNYLLDRSEGRVATATASLAVHAAMNDAADLEQRVRGEVRQAYRAWERSRASVGIQTKAVSLAEKQARLAEIRYDRGVAGNFDVVDAENQLFQAQSDLEVARIERALAGLTLRRVTGQLDPGWFLP